MPPMQSTANEDLNAMTWVGAFFACLLSASLCFLGSSNHPWLLVPAIIFTVIAVISPVMYISHWVVKKNKIKCCAPCQYLLCVEPPQRDAVEYYKAHRSDPEAPHESAEEKEMVEIDLKNTEG